MTKAAVLTDIGARLEIYDDVEVADAQVGELRLRMVAAGVCHSDLSMQNGTLASSYPVVLGHEGAGIVEQVGSDNQGFEVGDHVVVSWIPQCGKCFYCRHGQPYLCELAKNALSEGAMLDGTTRMSRRGQPLRQMTGVGAFAERIVVPMIAAVKVADSVDLKYAALLGCGVLTGVGAALNTAAIQAGDTVAVVGCGAVGLCTIQGSRIARAGQIVAIDVKPEKLALAKKLGATAIVNAADDNAISLVREMTDGRGADVVFEVIGNESTIKQAITMTRRGGEAVLVGIPPPDAGLGVRVFGGLISAGKTVSGCWYGSADVRRDIPRLIDSYTSGQLRLDELVSGTTAIEGINEAFDALRRGDVARTVVVY